MEEWQGESDEEAHQSGSDDDGGVLEFPEYSSPDGGEEVAAEDSDNVSEDEPIVEDEQESGGAASDHADQHQNGASNEDGPEKEGADFVLGPGLEGESSSDEERPANTIGNIPLSWYDDLPHIGYDLDGNKIMRPSGGQEDSLDRLIQRSDNPKKFSRSFIDDKTGERIEITDRELEIIQRIRHSRYASADFEENDPDLYFTSEVNIHPLSSARPPKSRFLPSKWEAKKIVELIKGLRQGRIKSSRERQREQSKATQHVYDFDIWDADTPQLSNRASKFSFRMIPAPKVKLPGHSESYNPPPEYLYTEAEKEAWETMDPEDRPINFIPQKFSSLRHVPAYSSFVKERFDRCLDLYLCPRVEKQKIHVDLESLVPKLPKPSELKPYPSTLSLLYSGHTQRIRSITTDPAGEWLCSGSDDCTVRIWEVSTTRCIRTLNLPARVDCVAWNPNPAVPIIAVAVKKQVYLYNAGVGSDEAIDRLRAVLQTSISSELKSEKGALLCRWRAPDDTETAQGILQVVELSQDVRKVVWHRRGDYFATVCPKGMSTAVLVHNLSRRGTQKPFGKNMGHIETVLFHPSKPHFFVASMRHVHVFNLAEQKRVAKLEPGLKMISSIAVHPSGDHLIVGSYDRRVVWFDLDMSQRPYKVLRFHEKAVRSVCFHPRYPLFATGSDDATTHVFHGKVFNDLTTNPTIVPLRVLRGHSVHSSLGVIDCVFHPTQPWLFSAGADRSLRLFISP
eukprot:c20566_g1_i2.p1 GENE.c20566_g1_i2~~c20566_g1_i2.p1  ORF type:complete len:735 (+),score=149.69 c20566_g1_i2:35-2239(+)